MRTKAKEIWPLIGYIVLLVVGINWTILRLGGALLFVPLPVAIIGALVGAGGVGSSVWNLLDPQEVLWKKIFAVVSPGLIVGLNFGVGSINFNDGINTDAARATAIQTRVQTEANLATERAMQKETYPLKKLALTN